MDFFSAPKRSGIRPVHGPAVPIRHLSLQTEGQGKG